MSTRTPKQIQAIKVEYRKLYNTELEEDIVNNTSGDFKNILVSLSTGNCDEKNSVDRLKANKVNLKIYFFYYKQTILH